MHKLFWALCILGSGIHVHAVESTVRMRIVRPNSVKEADDMFREAIDNWDVELMEILINKVPEDRKVTAKTVQKVFKDAAWNLDVELMDWLINKVPDKVTAQTVDRAFTSAVYAERVEVMDWLINKVPDKLTAQTVESALLGAAEYGRTKTVKYLLSQAHIAIDPQVRQRAFNKLVSNMDLKDTFNRPVSKMDLKDLAEIHFPKEVYKNSKELRALLAQNPLSGEELKAIMAIGTQDGRTSAFAQHLMSEQHYQDAEAMIKVRAQGTTKVSKLPKGVFRHMLEYVEPNIADKSNEQDQAKKGGHGNQE